MLHVGTALAHSRCTGWQEGASLSFSTLAHRMHDKVKSLAKRARSLAEELGTSMASVAAGHSLQCGLSTLGTTVVCVM